MKIYQVIGTHIKEIESDDEVTFLNGDVYLIDATDVNNKIYIWLGSKSSVDEKGVGAYVSHRIDQDLKKGHADIDTVVEGEEPPEFLQIVKFKVKEGNTPGFLKHVDLTKKKEYKLYRITRDESSEIRKETVKIHEKSLDSGDTFVLDAHEIVYIWIGKNSNVVEKYMAGRLGREIDVDRKRVPLVYTIEEGNEPPHFFELLDTLSKAKEEVSKPGKKKKKSFWDKLKFWQKRK